MPVPNRIKFSPLFLSANIVGNNQYYNRYQFANIDLCKPVRQDFELLPRAYRDSELSKWTNIFCGLGDKKLEIYSG